MVRDESLEKSKRAKNKEVEAYQKTTKKEDHNLASEMFKDIGCHQIEITKRLGRKEGEPKMRQETKNEILRKSIYIYINKKYIHVVH